MATEEDELHPEIVHRPDVAEGRAVFRDLPQGVTVERVLRMLAESHHLNTFESMPLHPQLRDRHVRAALRYAAHIIAVSAEMHALIDALQIQLRRTLVPRTTTTRPMEARNDKNEKP